MNPGKIIEILQNHAEKWRQKTREAGKIHCLYCGYVVNSSDHTEMHSRSIQNNKRKLRKVMKEMQNQNGRLRELAGITWQQGDYGFLDKYEADVMNMIQDGHNVISNPYTGQSKKIKREARDWDRIKQMFTDLFADFYSFDYGNAKQLLKRNSPMMYLKKQVMNQNDTGGIAGYSGGFFNKKFKP